MLFPQAEPVVKEAAGQAETFADPFDGAPGQEACSEDGQDEDGAVSRIRNEVIRKDGVRTAAAVTDDAGDAERAFTDISADEVHGRAAVVGMDPASAFGRADRTGLKLRTELPHEGVMQVFG